MKAFLNYSDKPNKNRVVFSKECIDKINAVINKARKSVTVVNESDKVKRLEFKK